MLTDIRKAVEELSSIDSKIVHEGDGLLDVDGINLGIIDDRFYHGGAAL